MKVKEESEKVGLKLNTQKTKIMTSSPITSWQTDGETIETVKDFMLWGSQITADGDCSHEIKRCLLLGRKAVTNLQFSSVQSLSCVRLFATPWIATRQASLSVTNTRSSLKLTSIESVMPSTHLILCRPVFLLPPIPPSIRVFSNESTLCMRWPNLDSILKSRDITLPTKVHLVKAMVFPVVMYGCESWIIKKAEHRRIDAFELWCWRRLLRDPWTARRSNQSILKEISPEYSLGGLMLKLKLQYFGHLMWRTDSLEKTLMLGGIGGRRKRGRQRMRWLDGITDSMDVFE